MRFVIGLMLGMALGASLGLPAAPQRGGQTIRIIREGFSSEAKRNLTGTTSS